MAEAKKCDICGMFYSPYNEQRDNELPNSFAYANKATCGRIYIDHSKIKDCCPFCMGNIMDFIEELGVNGGEIDPPEEPTDPVKP